jgi:hypothetical protein
MNYLVLNEEGKYHILMCRISNGLRWEVEMEVPSTSKAA